MSKGGKVPHDKMNIPNMNKNTYNQTDRADSHMNDVKHNSIHTHGIKAKSSTRAPNHSQKNG